MTQLNKWTPDSWKNKSIRQQATYPDQKALNKALDKLSSMPPLVTSWEIY